jgi:hypothetical protein
MRSDGEVFVNEFNLAGVFLEQLLELRC